MSSINNSLMNYIWIESPKWSDWLGKEFDDQYISACQELGFDPVPLSKNEKSNFIENVMNNLKEFFQEIQNLALASKTETAFSRKEFYQIVQDSVSYGTIGQKEQEESTVIAIFSKYLKSRYDLIIDSTTQDNDKIKVSWDASNSKVYGSLSYQKPVFKENAFKQALRNLRHNPVMTDLKILVNGELVGLASKAVLAAQNKAILAMLDSSMKEGQASVIDLKDTTPQAAALWLDYLYGCDVASQLKTMNEDQIADVLDLANQYLCQELIDLCIYCLNKMLKVSLSTEKLIKLRSIADLYNLPTVIKGCDLQFIVKPVPDEELDEPIERKNKRLKMDESLIIKKAD